jgi:hypothetical protein
VRALREGVLLLLLLLLLLRRLLLLGLLVGAMLAHGATRRRSQQAMVAGEVAGYTADGSALGATLGTRGASDAAREHSGQCDDDKSSFHENSSKVGRDATSLDDANGATVGLDGALL